MMIVTVTISEMILFPGIRVIVDRRERTRRRCLPLKIEFPVSLDPLLINAPRTKGHSRRGVLLPRLNYFT